MRKRTVLNIIAFSFILLLQPGFNAIQQMQLYPSHFGIKQPIVTIPTSARIPIARASYRPELTAKSMIAIDQESGAILYAKNPDVQNYPASLTKLMTAIVALQIYPLDRVITVGDESEAVGSSMHLEKGERDQRDARGAPARNTPIANAHRNINLLSGFTWGSRCTRQPAMISLSPSTSRSSSSGANRPSLRPRR